LKKKLPQIYWHKYILYFPSPKEQLMILILKNNSTLVIAIPDITRSCPTNFLRLLGR